MTITQQRETDTAPRRTGEPHKSRRAPRRALALGAVGIIASATAIAFLMASGGAPSGTAGLGAPGARSDGGPQETAVAAAVASGRSSRPDESAVAAAIGVRTERAAGRPDEGVVAAAVTQGRAEEAPASGRLASGQSTQDNGRVSAPAPR